MHLCAALQEILGLVEPPHFLVPGYTATIDRWLDPQTRQIQTSAEIYRPAQRHQALLNAVFDTGNLVWNVAPWQEGLCDPIVLETYRHQFPQLWEDHDLIVRFERTEGFSRSYSFGESYFSRQRPSLAIELPTRQKELNIENSYPIGTPTPFEEASFGGAPTLTRMGKDNASDLKQSYPVVTRKVRGANFQEERPMPIENASSGRAAELTQLDYTGNSTPNTNTESFANEDAKHSHDDSEKMDIRSQSLRAQGYVLRLFVSGNSAATEETLKSLHQLLEHALHHPYTLKVIDIFNHPDQAEENHISATPTLVRVWPLPVRRIVGDLNDMEKVLRILAAPEA